MKNKGEVVLCVIAAVIFIALIAATSSSCDGKLVRGLFWYECIKGE